MDSKIHEVAKSGTRLGDFPFTLSSILAWRMYLGVYFACQRQKMVTEDEMAGWHIHKFTGHELGQIPGHGEGQGGVCTEAHAVAKS